MRTATIEQRIIDHLKVEFEGEIAIERYPNNPTGYQLIHPVAAVHTRYTMTNWSRPTDNKNTIGVVYGLQDWEFIIVARNLRQVANQKGIYEILERIRYSIQLLSIKGHGFFYPIADDFLLEQNGVWHYGMHFYLPTRSVRGMPEEDPDEDTVQDLRV